MLIDNITSYKTLINEEAVKRSINISNRSLIGDAYNDICELHSLLSVLDFAEITSEEKEEILSYVSNKYKLKKVGLPVLNFLNIGL
jgi:hypothetical protein